MVFVVKSTASNSDRRDAIRSTWGNVEVFDGIMFETVFALGDSANSTLQQKIVQENHNYGDILQYDLKDGPQWVFADNKSSIIKLGLQYLLLFVIISKQEMKMLPVMNLFLQTI